MSNSSDTTDAAQPFEKNRYFAAKLMTARDMLAEQDYHANRLEAIARHVLGAGVVSGLEVETLTSAGDALSATVPAGFAIDPSGDLIVVPEADEVEVRNASTDAPLSAPFGERLAVYLRYDECSVERVPLPGSENACKQECTYNRIVESFSLVCRDLASQNGNDEGLPLLETELGVADISFPDLDTLEDDASTPLDRLAELTRIAREYTPVDRTEDVETTTGDVFLGIFKTDGAGIWNREHADLDGAFVATNELLYAAIAQHTADYENPHGTTLTVSESDDVPDAQQPLIRVRNDEWGGGAVNFLTDNSLSITGESNGRATPDSLTFAVDWTQLDEEGIVVESLQDDEGGPEITGDVTVMSDWLKVATDDNTDPNTLSLNHGPLVIELGGATPTPDGKIVLTSTDDSIAIDTSTDATVDLQVKDPVSAERDALAMYVRDKTLKYTVEAFHDVIHQYAGYSHATEVALPAQKIMERAGKALDEREFTDQVKFATAIQDIFEQEATIRKTLKTSREDTGIRDLATNESYGDYDDALTELENLLDQAGGSFDDDFFEKVSATELAVLQDQVAETATWLEIDEDERLALREVHTSNPAVRERRFTEGRILKDIVGRTPTPIKTRKFELGEEVVDKDAGREVAPAVVIENAKEMASEWTVTNWATDTTVAADNPSYPDDDLVVLVSYVSELGDASQEIAGDFEHWRASDPDDLFFHVLDREIPFYAFPESRLDYVHDSA